VAVSTQLNHPMGMSLVQGDLVDSSMILGQGQSGSTKASVCITRASVGKGVQSATFIQGWGPYGAKTC